MKRNLSWILSLILVLTIFFTACESSSATIESAYLITTTPQPTGAMDLDLSLDLDLDIKPNDPVPDHSIDFDSDIKPNEPIGDPIDVPGLNASLNLELPEHNFNIELNDHDIQAFLQDAQLNFSQEDLAALEKMDPAELAKLIEIRASLLADLRYAFEKTGIAVHIDEKSGEINLDATVLFDVDEYAVSDEGKKLLKSFMEVYTFVVYHERYNGFISNILIEGHTDSTGEYEYNQELSQKRADAVLSYILSDDCGLVPEHREAFRQTVTAKGYSWDRLIYDENGVEDKDASRRVAFRFLIDL